MKQLLQDVSSGELTVAEVPAPARGPASLLVATQFSLISAGTERAVLELGRSSLVGKARARPDLVAKVVESARTEGVAPTLAKVRGRLQEPNPLGYSLSGVVLEACPGAPAAPGERVACGGVGHASHAEVVAVPRTLCARVPDGVSSEDAAYATVGCVALHGVRLSEAGLGDMSAVVGLGLLGQITLELLAAGGGVPVGFDPDAARVELARAAGFAATTDLAEFESEVARLTQGRGADAVLVTAASRSAEPLATATAVARDRAVVCVVGDVKVESPRAPLFSKELRLVVSRSYGPGRYDPAYEDGGIDYPAGYVRWTEGRNLAEVLRLMAAGSLRPSRLTTHTFDLDDGPSAYELLADERPSLGILLRHPGDAGLERSIRIGAGTVRRRRRVGRRVRVAVVGAGTFARSVLMPEIARSATIVAVANRTGPSAASAAQRFDAAAASTEPEAVVGSPDVDAVVIATRHDTHARYAVEALEAGKHVFVEKPLALDAAELDRVIAAAERSEGVLMVGFNRRFAPLSVRLKDALGARGPLVMTCRVNAGRLPADHWTHDPAVGGGRLVGEGCHFVDLLSYIADGLPSVVSGSAVGGGSEPREDDFLLSLAFSDGSIGQVTYTAFGDRSLSKERIEVLGEAGAGVIDDFRQLTLHLGGKATVTTSRRDKGHRAEVAAFLEACRSGEQPWPAEEMAAVMRATFDAREAIAGVPR